MKKETRRGASRGPEMCDSARSPTLQYFDFLIDVIWDHPAIDNHAHPLLAEENRDRLAFEGLTSEA